MLAVAVGAALAGGTMPGFRDGEFMAPAKGEAIALLALLVPLLSSWIAANRPSFGDEGLAAQASAYREQGVHRDDMVVLPRDQAAPASQPLTSEQIAQMVAAVKVEMLRDPAGSDPLVSKAPTWLPSSGSAEMRG